MRTIVMTAAVAATLLFTACGSSKQTATAQQSVQPIANQGLGEEIAKSPAQLYAEDLSIQTLKGYANYNALPSMPVEALATNNARGDLAQSIAALVKAAVKTYADQYGQENLSNDELNKRLEGASKANVAIETVAKELIRMAPVKVRNSYRQKNFIKI